MNQQPRTPASLNEILDVDFSWRRKELAIFKNLVPNQSNDIQKATIRAGIVLLYAHWEDFIKKTANTYYEFLSYQNHKIKDYQNNLVAILLKYELNNIIENKRNSKESELIEKIINQFDEIAHFPNKAPIKTSNLNYEVLEDVCALTQVDIERLELPKQVIQDLLEHRNTIAHGHYLRISFEDFQEIYKKIISVLFEFKSEVSNSASLKRYLKQP